ncbi:MAG: hypothetical protein EOO71_02040 [Myxococcaceae bacterium]|nr:MAG: hypothetical protein EOO71_02040 [Myxococcaceae bacterium]
MKKNQNRILLLALLLTMIQGCGINCQGACDPTRTYPEPESCPIPGHTQGEAGGECNNFLGNSGCNDPEAFACVANSCIPCGQTGQVCCAYQTCHDGSGCANDDSDETKYRVCTNDCNAEGATCCSGNNCTNGLMCDGETQKCVATATESCGQGPNAFLFNIRRADTLCGSVISFNETTLEAAKTCLQPQMTQQNLEFVASTEVLKKVEVCNSESGFDPSATVTVEAFSDADALVCAHSLCINCKSTVLGPCPPTP